MFTGEKETEPAACKFCDVSEAWLTLLDFRDLPAYRSAVRKFRPDYLCHVGAHTDLASPGSVVAAACLGHPGGSRPLECFL